MDKHGPSPLPAQGAAEGWRCPLGNQGPSSTADGKKTAAPGCRVRVPVILPRGSQTRPRPRPRPSPRGARAVGKRRGLYPARSPALEREETRGWGLRQAAALRRPQQTHSRHHYVAARPTRLLPAPRDPPSLPWRLVLHSPADCDGPELTVPNGHPQSPALTGNTPPTANQPLVPYHRHPGTRPERLQGERGTLARIPQGKASPALRMPEGAQWRSSLRL